MGRRDLLAVVGGAAAFPTFVAAAADKPFRVGVVSLVNGRSSPQFVAFEQRLRELASATGQDLTIDFTVLDGDAERFAAAMQEQVQRGVDVLLAPGQKVALKAAQAATQTIPIVMVAIDHDPVALGYVELGAAGWQHHRGLSGHDRVCRQARAAIEGSGPRHHSVHRLLGRGRARQLRGDCSGRVS